MRFSADRENRFACSDASDLDWNCSPLELKRAVAEPTSFRQLVRHPGFAPLWMADGFSNLGIIIFTLSLQLLLIENMAADPLETRAPQAFPRPCINQRRECCFPPRRSPAHRLPFREIA